MAFVRGFLTALIGSLVANLALLFLIRPFVIDSATPLNALSIGPVSVFTILGVVGATIVYALLRRFLTNPNMIFVWIAVVVLIISFVPDYMVIGQTTGMFAGGNVASALLLMLMHVVTAAIVVWSMTNLWGKRSITAS